ncbi:hypothetical protein HZA97_08805 [Candidatus Woesearchaeota archaeon]|nr:hypothetical protein [Candidatus Woesearchaeota archaeon]
MIPINPGKKLAKRSLWSEFAEGFLLIFTHTDPGGIIFSIINAIIFLTYWIFFLVGKYVLRIDMDNPTKIKDH